jgi:hypothetical protein
MRERGKGLDKVMGIAFFVLLAIYMITFGAALALRPIHWPWHHQHQHQVQKAG